MRGTGLGNSSSGVWHMVAVPKVLNHRTWTLGVAEEWEKGVAMEGVTREMAGLVS